ncbi:MFS transporter [Gemmobacter fulvus]|uniref:MFS transporter n=1 Tax=Gemmobacter fulvus TaxID=2840474 RepID=A0A975P4W7_9RHOB|nr:MFS transporter [Gemmobacter fulvus]MBT9247589.1 MFS transporter [Gemmobacter fulvus]QWK89905.1 MFS transporter [Gemmobacter fulvus]
MTDAQQGRWAVAAMFLANGFIMGAWAPQIPLLLPRHGIGEAMLGLLILVLGLGAVAAMLFAGRLIQRHGARRVLCGFAFAVIPVLPLVVIAPNLPLLALAMALFGALIGCMDVAMNANAVEVERGMRRAIMSSSHGFWSLGGFLGGSIGGLALAQWGAVAQALGVAAAVALIVTLAAPRIYAAPETGPMQDAPKTRLLPRDPLIWVIGLMALLCMVPEGAVMDWAALYLLQEHGAGVAVAGMGFALFSGAMAIMRFAGDAVRNRFGAVLTLRASAILAALALMVAAAAPSAPVVLVAFAVAGLGIANTVPIMFSAAGNHPGMASGAALSTVTMIGYSGILVAPSSIGFVAEHIGFRWTYGALALLLLVVAALAGLVRAADAARH